MSAYSGYRRPPPYPAVNHPPSWGKASWKLVKQPASQEKKEKKRKEKKQGKKRTKSNLNSIVTELFTKLSTLSLNPAPRILGYPFGEPEVDMVTAASEAQRG